MNQAIMLLSFLMHTTIVVLGQEQDSLLILVSESSWGAETFHFPLDFAPDLNFEGTEDARFPKGWRKQESPEFWSYAFAWNIKLNQEMTGIELEESIKIYFDGLMNVVNKDTSIVVPKTTALFVDNEVANSVYGYKGKVKIFDAFSTNKPMTLHATVDQYYCEDKMKSIILFKFSPQRFGSDIWKTLEQIRPHADVCD